MGRNVVFLGLTSLLTDVSSEMVNAGLPLYLTFVLRFTPLQFGIFDGLYQGASALVRMWGGLTADRLGQPKRVAAVGYATSALCKIGLLAAGPLWIPTTLLLMFDRLGKGLRSPPRDALIALSSTPDHAAEAFGVHRAMDTAGALIGPLLTFAILSRAPIAFDAVFVVSFAFGVAGLGALVLLVENRTSNRLMAAVSTAGWRSAVALLRLADFRILVVAGTVLGLATVGDALLYLVIQRRANLAPSLFPLLPVAVALAYLVLSVPAGRVADEVGRGRVFLGGYGALAVAYALLVWPAPSSAAILTSLVLVGAYYAATDGVLMAMASRSLPPERLTSGLALLTTAIALARLVASMLFGAVWSSAGPERAVLLFLAALTVALGVAAALLRGAR